MQYILDGWRNFICFLSNLKDQYHVLQFLYNCFYLYSHRGRMKYNHVNFFIVVKKYNPLISNFIIKFFMLTSVVKILQKCIQWI